MPDIEKPTGTAAEEVMGENWPVWSETKYAAKVDELLAMASNAQKNAQTTSTTATYTGQETDGKAYNKILEDLHLKTNAFTVYADEFAKMAGWVKHMGEQIAATKKTIVAEVKAHEANCITGKTIDNIADMLKESQDVAEHKANVTAAMTALETEFTAGETACAADVVPAPPGGTPGIPDEHVNPSGMPGTDPTATAPTPGTTTGSEGTGTTGGGSTTATAPAAPLPPEMFAAPAAPAAAAPAEALSGSPASSPAAAPADAAGGMPMSGMPMSGMPMQPPQMPAGGAGQTPGNDLAKTVGDTVTKLAGKDGGTPVSEAALSKLLDAQGDGTGEGGHPGEKGANGEDPDKLPDGVDPLAKVFGNDPNGSGTNGATAQERGALDPYTSANQNPGLNNPTPPHLASPSPAAPVITPAPSAPLSAPMTELSADPNYIGAPQHQAPALSPESVTTHPSAGPGSPAGPGPAGPGGPGGNPGAGPQPGQPLGAYNPGAMGTPAPMGPMAPMAPMGGMMPPPAGGGGAAAPVLAAAVPAAAVTEAATSGRRRSPEVPTRLASLPPEHAAAEHHLAALVRVFAQRNWPTAVLAIACVEGQHGVRYLLATADGVSLIPLGVPLPGGVELLSSQPLSGSFTADWSGHVHPARKLAAWAADHPEAGRLVYLVSNDTSGVPAVAGKVIEVRQTQAERSGMGGGSPAILPRTSLAADTIPPAKAEAALEAFANAWGISDATADDWRVAPGRLWAARWDRDRPADYPAILATYLYVEGLEAVREGRAADAAFSASALATVRPYDWVAA